MLAQLFLNEVIKCLLLIFCSESYWPIVCKDHSPKGAIIRCTNNCYSIVKIDHNSIDIPDFNLKVFNFREFCVHLDTRVLLCGIKVIAAYILY